MTSFRQYLQDLVIRKKILSLLLLLTLTLSAATSVALYLLARSSLDRSLQKSLKHSAITAALLVDGDALDRVRTRDDLAGPDGAAVQRAVARVREANKLASVYVLRRSDRAGHAEFVVDASASRTAAFGEQYSLATAPAMERAFVEPAVDADIVTDSFGASLSGYAPIRRQDGSTAGIIGLDIDASDVLRNRLKFKLLAAGIGLAFVVVAIAGSLGFARLFTRPILDMSERVRDLSAGKLEARMVVRGRDEIGQLSAAMNRMFDTLSRYLPIKLVGQILGSSADLKLGGSVVNITCFFSDIAGFTTISEKLSPQQTVSLLNEYLTAMTDIIEKLNGTVDKYVGDAVVAFWGAPLPVADHASLACEAALLQLEAAARLREKWRAEGLPDIRFRIGLNTGDVVAGNMGSSRRFNYTVMGDSVNLASRLEGANKNYGSRVLMGSATYESVKATFECRRLDRIRVVGKMIPIAIYELLGRKGQLDAAVLAARDRFESALDAFAARRWDEAEALFRAAAPNPEADPAVALYLRRIADLRAVPPPADWDATYDLTSK